ncbi:MAG: 3-oxo-tetronate 4-phosphate decarboxylase [Ignavibacteriaceae bacterium]|nr:3-oxo-tetronate 4-phosphate decarboxylase [Ignavibacteriaceae bacterium]
MSPAAEIILIGKLLQQAGMVAATDGNISVRADAYSFYITASGVRKDSLTENDIIKLDLDCNPVTHSNKPSTESKIHAALYKARPDIGAVVHAHPVHATAFSASPHSLDQPVFPEVVLSLGRIPLCKYATPSTADLPASLDPYIEFATVFLLQNHGAVATGKTLEQAFNRMDKLEHYAKMMSILITTGGFHQLKRKKLKELYAIAEKIYGITLHPKNRFL